MNAFGQKLPSVNCYQCRQDLFDEVEFEAERTGWRRVIQGNKVFARYWCPVSDSYSVEFVAELNSLFDEPICER